MSYPLVELPPIVRRLRSNAVHQEQALISATQIYDYVSCPHRVLLDVYADPAQRDEPNAFIELLWQEGMDHEEAVLSKLGVTANLRDVPIEEREQATRAAMARGEPLIYRGRITTVGRVGEPDLLERVGHGYVPGDIKSGAGLEDEEHGGARLKKTYAFQLAHYVGILEDEVLGGWEGESRRAFIIDRSAERVSYELMQQQGARMLQSWWDAYQDALQSVTDILTGVQTTRPALGATCKLCHWYSRCKRDVIARDDLTQIAELGRSKRDVLMAAFPTVLDLAASSPEDFVRGKKTDFPGIGPETLHKLHARARLLKTPGARPYLKLPVMLPVATNEVYFDIEADPMRDVVYLHGFVERRHGEPRTARFLAQFAEGVEPEHEQRVFAASWRYLVERVKNSVVYYYSKYERTAYKKLARKYPDVCSETDVEELFALPAMVDLYTDVVKKATEWPTYDQSIKTLAQYLGFRWRDTHPSGAASIEWYHRWIESGDPAIRQRILDYNEDDCLATGVVVDGVRQLEMDGQT